MKIYGFDNKTIATENSKCVKEAKKDYKKCKSATKSKDSESESSDSDSDSQSDEKTPNKKATAFDLLDKDRNGTLGNFEMYSMFTAMDSNKDYSVSANELLSWMFKNEEQICRPFEK